VERGGGATFRACLRCGGGYLSRVLGIGKGQRACESILAFCGI
jgi:hypothetical protein